MPLYEYQCQQCHRLLEKIQKFSDAPLTTCPHCGGALEKTVTAPAIQFKGAGWYKDLYSSAKPPAKGSAEGGTAAAGGDTAAAPSSTEKGAAAPASPSTSAAPTPSAPSGGGGGGSSAAG